MFNNIKYRIGRYITGPLTYKFSNFKPNSAGSYKMRNEVTEYNINNLIPSLLKVSNYFETISITKSEDLIVDKNFESLISKKFKNSGSDKSTVHNYETIYAYILNILPENLTMLEIGLGTNNPKIISNMGVDGVPGSSLRAFSSLLPKATIYGADIDREILFSKDNIKCFYIDQKDYRTYTSLLESIGDSQLDLIIDDGLHTQSTNLNTLYFAIKNLSLGGYLIIEDIPEYAIELWEIASNLIDDKFHTEIIKTRHFYVFILKKLR